ncbi:hypothetical protein [Mycobacterium helveticum]|uniref:Uncharacterized protein n=1 Tax=Mycobacterium helveticum TaxID=2592811 RepID=A0A557Y0K8_9MYCO|nr:hypothetical protein [Mycobacterium helveticum]TVS88985.1 hypothetical protein FPZ46_04080 [Mycobacterium helveticum]TVS92094.1 hypothetical protein FPZ47_02385 [Mycobacterium helveticum]
MTSMDSESVDSEVNVRTAERIAGAPLPTRSKLRMRQNLLVQFWRFTSINLKMMRIIFSGHH